MEVTSSPSWMPVRTCCELALGGLISGRVGEVLFCGSSWLRIS